MYTGKVYRERLSSSIDLLIIICWIWYKLSHRVLTEEFAGTVAGTQQTGLWVLDQ